MKKFLILALITLVGFTAQAQQDAKTIFTRSYELTLNDPHKVKCLNPVVSKYPVKTMLIFKQPAYDLWVHGIWTNVESYDAEVGYVPCRQLTELLKNSPVVTVEQTVTLHKRKGASGHCIHETKEEAKFSLSGIQFTGSKLFIAGPFDEKECE